MKVFKDSFLKCKSADQSGQLQRNLLQMQYTCVANAQQIPFKHSVVFLEVMNLTGTCSVPICDFWS